jgi:hypothetical protein
VKLSSVTSAICGGRGPGKGSSCSEVWYDKNINTRLKELVRHIDDWPVAVQKEAIASLEALAGYVSFHGSTHKDS